MDIVYAIETHNYDLFNRFFHDVNRNEITTQMLATTAAKNGCLEIVKLLHQIDQTCMTENVAWTAALFGQLDVLTWYVTERVGPWNPLSTLSALSKFDEGKHDMEESSLRCFSKTILGTNASVWSNHRMISFNGWLTHKHRQQSAQETRALSHVRAGGSTPFV